MARVELETKSDGKRELLIEKKGIDLRVLFCTWYSLRAFFFVCVCFFPSIFCSLKKNTVRCTWHRYLVPVVYYTYLVRTYVSYILVYMVPYPMLRTRY